MWQAIDEAETVQAAQAAAALAASRLEQAHVEARAKAEAKAARIASWLAVRLEAEMSAEQQAVEAQRLASIKAQIVAIYQARQPRKLADVDGLLEEWKGEEDVLLRKIKDKWLPADATVSEGAGSTALSIVDNSDGKGDVDELLERFCGTKEKEEESMTEEARLERVAEQEQWKKHIWGERAVLGTGAAKARAR